MRKIAIFTALPLLMWALPVQATRESGASPQSRGTVASYGSGTCLRQPRDPEGAVQLDRSQVALVDAGRLQTALGMLRARSFVPLSDHDARVLIRGFRVRPGRRAYLLGGGVATGARLPLFAYYRTAQGMDLFAWWHQSDRHLELVTVQRGMAPLVFSRIAFVVQTELEISGASAVCYIMTEQRR